MIFRDPASVLEACKNASARSAVRAGAAIDDVHDALFALGFPVVRFVDPAHEADSDVEKALASANKKYPAYGLRWPAKVAHALLRKWARRPPSVDPFDEASLRELAAWFACGRAPGAYDLAEDAILLLEAIGGSDVVVEAAVDALERVPDNEWGASNVPSWTLPHTIHASLHALGHVMLRASDDVVRRARERLERLYATRSATHPPDDGQFATRALDVLLHGAAGARRSGHRLAAAIGGHPNPRFLGLAGDDPAYIVEVVGKSDGPYAGDGAGGRFEARLAWLAGPAIVAHYAKTWRKTLKASADAEGFVATMGCLRSPEVASLLEAMSVDSKAKKLAKTILARHRPS